MLSRARALLRHRAAPTAKTPKAARSDGERLGFGQAAAVGGLAILTAWSGGTALAQVGVLADAAVPTPTAPSVAALAAAATVQAEIEAQHRAQADTRRRALATAARALAAAALGDAAMLRSDARDTSGLLDEAERAAALRAERLKLVLRSLGLRGSSLASTEPPAALIKTSAAATAPGGADPAMVQRLGRVAKEVQGVQSLSAVVARLPVAPPLADPVRSSGFGGRSDPFTGYHAFHAGQDFSGERMTKIEATAPGVVSFTGQRSGYGNTVEVDHGGGFKTRYAHLAAIAVRVGQVVGLGDRLGGMGSTGRSTGTHLHYEVWVNGQVQNPERFLRAGQLLAGIPGFQRWAKGSATEATSRPYRVASAERRHGRIHARFGG